MTSNMVRGAFARQGGVGHEFVHVRNAAEAEAAAAGAGVLLVDWEGAPPEQCAEWIYAARGKASGLPILLLCPKALAGATLAGLKAGATGVVNKPFDPDELVSAVEKAVAAAEGPPKPTVNVEFINPFVDGCKNVFQTMCRMPIERRRLYLQEDHRMFGDVSGVMGLSGAAQGSVVVSLPKALACRAVAAMLGESPKTEVDQDVCDGVGEIINMISGHAKAALVKTRYHFTISLPSVIVGRDHEIAHRRGVPNIAVIFAADGGEFALQVCLEPSASA